MTGLKQHSRKASIALLVALALGQKGAAQLSYPNLAQSKPIIAATAQFNQGHYLLASQSCRQYLDREGSYLATDHTLDKERAAYYTVIAGIRSNFVAGEKNALAFAAATQNDAYRQRVYFALAQHYFTINELAEAIPYYEKTSISNLTNDEIADAKFELAYCYFSERQFEKAAPLFASIKEIKEEKYYVAGNYYFGLLSYNEDKLAEALQSFQRIREVKEYRQVVPYYMAEINYFMGNRDTAIAIADKIIASSEKSLYDKEVHLLAAQCYFEKQEYTKARPYFEYYYEHSSKIRKEDLYKIGYCYYRLNEWSAATEKFKALSETNDSMGQSSMYLLGDCYLKTGDRKGARSAFGICAGLSFIKGQQEASLMIYSRLSYEAGYNDEALHSLNELLRLYPAGIYKDEAKTLLSSLYIKSNDYEGALQYLDGVSRHDQLYWQVYQLACYGHAVQLFRTGDYATADAYFGRSLDHSVNATYQAAAYFWRSELSYKLHRYNDAVSYGKYFLDNKVSQMDLDRLSQQVTPQHAWMNMGFASMELQDFTNAQKYFNQAQAIKGADNATTYVAALQEADAVFLQNNYTKALTLYSNIAAKDSTNADYANYQRSIILGLQGKNKDKIGTLKSLLHKTPASAYEMTAMYELAVTYIETDQYPDALKTLKYITDTATDPSYGPKAWLKTGFIYQQQNDIPTAITAYKSVITGFPASDERVGALDALRSLFIQTNQPGAFAAVLRDAGLPSSENASIDSTYYAAAESQFATGKWDASKQGFTNYLTEFPNGVFVIKAHYYRGQTYYQLKQLREALADFEKVLTVAWNDFSENSARNAATIAFELKNYKSAFTYYERLRYNGPKDQPTIITAFSGMLKSAYLDSNYDGTEKYADTLLKQPGLSAEQISEALLYKANAGVKTGKNDTALALFHQLADNKNGEIAAEAHYRIAEILYTQDSLADAELAANETIKVSSGYDYWVVRAYLLLADILIKQQDYFNARATLNSIIQHTRNETLKAEATAKLAVVKALEKTKTKLKDE